MLSSLSIEKYSKDQHDKMIQAYAILSQDPIDWKRFLEIDQELAILSHQNTFDCSMAWILSHSPPEPVIHTLLERYHNDILNNEEMVKSILKIGLSSSITEVVKFICSYSSSILHKPLDESGDYPIHRAQKVDIAKIILEAAPETIGAKNHNLDLPLHTAFIHQHQHSHPDLVSYLIQQGKAMQVGGEAGKGGVLVRNKLGKTPFDMLNEEYALADLSTISYPKYTADRRMWVNLTEMVKAIKEDVGDGVMDAKIVDAVVELGCAPQAVKTAKIMAGQE